MKNMTLAIILVLSCLLCAGCGHTHDWQDATHTSPKTCTICQKTEGDPLPAVLAEFSYMTEGLAYPYVTKCYDADATTEATVFVDNYRVVASEEGFEAKEGYEWRMADAHFVFSDEFASMYGYTYHGTFANYYYENKRTSDESTYLSDGGAVVSSITVQMNGKEEALETRVEELPSAWVDGKREVVLKLAVQVPIGYDGVVWRFYNTIAAEDPAAGEMYTIELYKAQESIFFRFD